VTEGLAEVESTRSVLRSQEVTSWADHVVIVEVEEQRERSLVLQGSVQNTSNIVDLGFQTGEGFDHNIGVSLHKVTKVNVIASTLLPYDLPLLPQQVLTVLKCELRIVVEDLDHVSGWHAHMLQNIEDSFKVAELSSEDSSRVDADVLNPARAQLVLFELAAEQSHLALGLADHQGEPSENGHHVLLCHSIVHIEEEEELFEFGLKVDRYYFGSFENELGRFLLTHMVLFQE